MRSLLFVLLLAPLACDLHGSTCQRGAYEGLAPTAGSLRDPQTGACEPLPESSCDPALTDLGNALLLPDWAACGTYCEVLDQPTCATTAGCRVIVQNICPPDADCGPESIEYAGCWAIAPSGPTPGGCTGLPAQSCSSHENCIAVHQSDFTTCTDPTTCLPPLGTFSTCLPE